MRGGVALFRGTGAGARRYLESAHSPAERGGGPLARFAMAGARGEVLAERPLTADEYAGWVDWIDPVTRMSMGAPRRASGDRRDSPRFAEMIVNVPKSLSIAAAVYGEVALALEDAQQDAAAEIRSWLANNSATRVGSRSTQTVVPVERLQTVTAAGNTSRAGDPHWHVHFQIGARVWASEAWRALDMTGLFRQQGEIRAIGAAILAEHPGLTAVLDAHGLTLDPISGEVGELAEFNGLMSKRGAQIARNLARFRADWQAAHPGAVPGTVASGRLKARAWKHERPCSGRGRFSTEEGWTRELTDAGYVPENHRDGTGPLRDQS